MRAQRACKEGAHRQRARVEAGPRSNSSPGSLMKAKLYGRAVKQFETKRRYRCHGSRPAKIGIAQRRPKSDLAPALAAFSDSAHVEAREMILKILHFHPKYAPTLCVRRRVVAEFLAHVRVSVPRL